MLNLFYNSIVRLSKKMLCKVAFVIGAMAVTMCSAVQPLLSYRIVIRYCQRL